MILTESGKLYFANYNYKTCTQLPLSDMGINGDTTVNCIANIVNDLGQVTLATRDGQIYRFDRSKEKFVLISGNELHDGSTITEVDELCHLISNRQ